MQTLEEVTSDKTTVDNHTQQTLVYKKRGGVRGRRLHCVAQR